MKNLITKLGIPLLFACLCTYVLVNGYFPPELLAGLAYSISLLFLFECYASISGYKDGILYSKQGAEALPWDEHKLYTAERIVVGAIFTLSVLIGKLVYWVSVTHFILWLVFMAIGIFLSFSFFHNGFYNIARKHIDKPEMKFMSTTRRHGVTMHVPPVQRVAMLIVGVLLVVLTSYNTIAY